MSDDDTITLERHRVLSGTRYNEKLVMTHEQAAFVFKEMVTGTHSTTAIWLKAMENCERYTRERYSPERMDIKDEYEIQ